MKNFQNELKQLNIFI